jgi:hypothetical protein
MQLEEIEKFDVRWRIDGLMLLSLSLPHRAAKSKMAPYVEEFEESLAVSSKVPPKRPKIIR